MFKPLAPLAHVKMPRTPSRISSPIEVIFSLFGSAFTFWCATFFAWCFGSIIGLSIAAHSFEIFSIWYGPLTLLLIAFVHPLAFLIPLTVIISFIIGMQSESTRLRLVVLTLIFGLAILSSYLLTSRIAW